MTAKRFIRDNHTGYLYDNGEIVEDIMELLNALNDENEQLKYNLSAHMVDLNNYKGKCSALEKENEQLKQQVNCHKSRIQLLSPLLDLADTIIDLSDDEKAKAFWEKKNNEVEQEWNKILKGDVE